MAYQMICEAREHPWMSCCRRLSASWGTYLRRVIEHLRSRIFADEKTFFLSTLGVSPGLVAKAEQKLRNDNGDGGSGVLHALVVHQFCATYAGTTVACHHAMPCHATTTLSCREISYRYHIISTGPESQQLPVRRGRGLVEPWLCKGSCPAR